MVVNICFPRRLELGCDKGDGQVFVISMGTEEGVWMREGGRGEMWEVLCVRGSV